jgi:hypothetical protein
MRKDISTQASQTWNLLDLSLPFACNQYNFHIAATCNLESSRGPVRRQAQSVMMSVQKKRYLLST